MHLYLARIRQYQAAGVVPVVIAASTMSVTIAGTEPEASSYVPRCRPRPSEAPVSEEYSPCASISRMEPRSIRPAGSRGMGSGEMSFLVVKDACATPSRSANGPRLSMREPVAILIENPLLHCGRVEDERPDRGRDLALGAEGLHHELLEEQLALARDVHRRTAGGRAQLEHVGGQTGGEHEVQRALSQTGRQGLREDVVDHDAVVRRQAVARGGDRVVGHAGGVDLAEALDGATEREVAHEVAGRVARHRVEESECEVASGRDVERQRTRVALLAGGSGAERHRLASVRGRAARGLGAGVRGARARVRAGLEDADVLDACRDRLVEAIQGDVFARVIEWHFGDPLSGELSLP